MQIFRLSAVEEVINCLTYRQREHLYGDNIFLQVAEFEKQGAKRQQGLLIAYDMDKKAFFNIVKKAIPVLLRHSVPVKSLPERMMQKKYAVTDWKYGDFYSSASAQVKRLCPEKYNRKQKNWIPIARYFDTGEFVHIAI